MELRQLERFLAVAEDRSFTRAASRLHVVQSALTTSIRLLEEELGTKLFARSTRHVRLSESGAAFLVEVQRTLAALQSARDAVSAVEGLLRGTLTIGIMQRFVSRVDLPFLLGRFRAEYPGVQLKLVQDGSSTLMEGIHAGRLDLAVLGLTGPAPEGVVTTLLLREPLFIAFPPNHPLASRRRIAFQDLSEENFVDLQPGRALRTITDRAFAAAGIYHRTVCEASDASTLLELVANGVGIGLVPQSATSYPVKISYVRPLPPVPTWDIAVAHLGEVPANPAAREILARLIAYAREGTSSESLNGNRRITGGISPGPRTPKSRKRP